MDKVTYIFKVLLTVFLFAVPIVLTMIVWFTPALEVNKFLVGVSTINLTLSIAEIMFLVRAVVFPRNGKKWWREMY